MTPLERIQTLAATAVSSHVPPTPPGCGEMANMLGEFGRAAMSDSQSTIGNNNRSLRRNRFSFNGRKPSFSWLSSTSSINSSAPVKGTRLVNQTGPTLQRGAGRRVTHSAGLCAAVSRGSLRSPAILLENQCARRESEKRERHPGTLLIKVSFRSGSPRRVSFH